MELQMGIIDFKINNQDIEALSQDELTTQYSLPIEGVILLGITRDDGTFLETEAEFSGQLTGSMFKVNDSFFFSPKANCKFVFGDHPEGITEAKWIIHNLLFGVNIGEWIKENTGVN